MPFLIVISLILRCASRPYLKVDAIPKIYLAFKLREKRISYRELSDLRLRSQKPKEAEYGNGDIVFSVTATDQSGNVSNNTNIVD